MKAKITVLGCGSSTGVPVIGCSCQTCLSVDAKDQRSRTSLLIETCEVTVVVDTGPDFRQQALKEKIHRLDGIILTHMHFDHIAGIDDTRVFVFDQKPPIPLLISQKSFEDFSVKYAYFFREHHSFTAKIEPICIEKFPQHREFLGLPLDLVKYYQGKMQVLGFKLGNFAYITDIKEFDENIYAELQGIEYLIISALKEESTPFHLSFYEAIAFSRRVGAKKTYLTHLSHDVNYEEASKKLPNGIYLAYDGLKFEISYERKNNRN